MCAFVCVGSICVACRARKSLAMGLILTSMIILACLLGANSHVTTTHLTKGPRKGTGRNREGDTETVMQLCPLVSLLILVISDNSDITSSVTIVFHQPLQRHEELLLTPFFPLIVSDLPSPHAICSFRIIWPILTLYLLSVLISVLSALATLSHSRLN